ncbi:MAG: putative manganese transporter [Desulfomonilaceae bacterium]|nr:putative manganese transporter [Desulfomonilaceae bacterium]
MEVLISLKHSLLISFLVFAMMLLTDFVDHAGRQRITAAIQGGCLRQYTLASFLGSTPGCLGAFMNVSLYLHGIISFGAIVGGMIATSGDEAFVMLVQFPKAALVLFALLFVCGIFFAWVADKMVLLFHLTPSAYCAKQQCGYCRSSRYEKNHVGRMFSSAGIIDNFRRPSLARLFAVTLAAGLPCLIILGKIGPPSWDWKRIIFTTVGLCALFIVLSCSEHYLRDHIWNHIIKAHLFRVFLWTFGALLFFNTGLAYWNLNAVVDRHPGLVLIFAAIVGLIPESGPHLIFVMMYAQGLIPFSVLFTASFVQDGHGMLPVLSFSIGDYLLIKGLNLVFGLALGGAIFAVGL